MAVNINYKYSVHVGIGAGRRPALAVYYKWPATFCKFP